jgi:hypothetical protein
MATIRTHRTARMNSSKSDEISGYYETVIIPNSKFQILYDVWIFLLPLINHQASNQASSFKLQALIIQKFGTYRYIPYRRYVHMFCFFRGAWAARAAGVLANWQGSFYKDFCDSCILDVLIALRENTVILMYD